MQLNQYNILFLYSFFFFENTINPIAKMLSKLDKDYIIRILEV